MSVCVWVCKQRGVYVRSACTRASLHLKRQIFGFQKRRMRLRLIRPRLDSHPHVVSLTRIPWGPSQFVTGSETASPTLPGSIMISSAVFIWSFTPASYSGWGKEKKKKKREVSVTKLLSVREFTTQEVIVSQRSNK